MNNDSRQLTLESMTLMERAQGGVVPSTLEGCTQLLLACGRVEKAAAAIRWVAIAAAKQCPELAEAGTGRGNKSPWVEWVKTNYEEYGNANHIHHMGQVGDLLIRSIKVCYRETLFGLPFGKLICLARLPDHLLPRFLERVAVQDLPVPSVRKHVNAWLEAAGEPALELEGEGDKDPKPPKHQADFLDVLFGEVECPEGEELYHQVEERLHRVDLPGTAATLTRSLCVANAALDRMAEEASAADLAPFAQNFEALLVHTRHAIAEKTGITE